MGHIEAVTVNHNTSLFTELMLRSLYKVHESSLDLSLTVLDNQSTDDTSTLQDFATSKNYIFQTTSYSTDTHYAGNTHGENFRNFVIDNPHCDYYLFLDTDIVFFQEDTINIMREELKQKKDIFGIQARMSWDGKTERPDGSWNRGGRESFMRRVRSATEEAIPAGTPVQGKAFRFITGDRISPVCCLIRNSPIFRSVVEWIGLSCASIERASGGMNFDTFSLMTQVMKTHDLSYDLSSKIVLHFGGVSYDNTNREDKRARCLRMLKDLRSDRA